MASSINPESTHIPFNFRDELVNLYPIKPMKVLSYRDMTIETHTTHLTKLKHLNIDPSSLTNKTISDALQLIKKSGRSGKELSNGYINGIYSTIRRINPSLNKSASKLGFPRRNRKTSIDDRLDVYIGIKKLLMTVINFVLNFTTIEPRKIESRRMTDTIIAIILTLLTNLRSAELFLLQTKHLDMISKEIPISIQTKHHSRTMTIMKINKLYDLLYPNIINMVISRELRYNTNYSPDTESTSTDLIQLLSCKNDTINKTFYELYIRINQKKPNTALGLKTILSFNLTLMFDPSSLLTPQTLNMSDEFTKEVAK